MSNPFNNPEITEINKILSEQEDTSSRVAINGKVAKYIDFKDSMDDPEVYLFGTGTMRLSQVKKFIKDDLVKFADLVGKRDAKDLMVFMTDFEGRKSSNMYFAYRLYGLMEIEEFMKSPQVKRKITMLKKKS